ncbi:PREDICTED: melanocyte protein PMEL isoform X1 [Poecilia mexicana]|uniref:melanocyte protein PMEL isoform X1 n=1 Tax=Poecilia mexicana TaxID=48701 RepID=UPI00072E7007|nr:PREDICTED: melanocyte protein PMEL isoform X1 [Poecilia mexicana]
MKTLVLLLLAFTSAMAIRQRSKFTRFKSWNSRIYPVWQDGDARFRNCWSGGNVTFDLKNDAPTLTGAKATFTINLNFPPNQTVLPDGQVVWARNCTVNGREYQEGQAVYPDRGDEWTGVFPDGSPFNRSQIRKPRYVFVWKTLGRYWQVADGPSSSLTIGTDDIPLGSYNMELVIYHCRGRDRFIPLGYASSAFTITDQVPFSLSLSQVNDVNQNDQNFIQNQAIAFTVALHDPSQYLNSADIRFTWDFGDNSGTLISRERTVTHTYLSVGAFRPQVVLLASIPCGNPTAVAPINDPAGPAVVVVTSSPAPPAAAEGEDATALDVTAADATPLDTADDEEAAADADTVAAEAASVAPAGVDAAVVPAEQDPADTGDAAAVETEAAAGEVATVAPAAEEPVEVEAAAEDATEAAAEAVPAAADAAVPAAEEEEAAEVADAPTVAPVVDAAVQEEANEAAEPASVAPEVIQDGTEVPAAAVDNVVAAAAATEATAAEEAAADTEAEVQETENAAAATVAAAAAEAEAVPDEGEVQAEVEADPAQVVLVVAKRQAPAENCIIDRYGSLATSVDVVQGIDSVEIVQMSNVVSMATELDQNAVDVTISCQGSLPSEVCTVISDADCVTPVQTVCGAASPSPDCQMILRQFFNDTGVFCLNVSLINDVSLAVASARVNVAVASGGSPAGTAATVLGVMVLACVVCCIGLMYRRFKQYQPLTEERGAGNGGSFVTSVPLLLWNLLSRQSPGESRPLLQGRIV